MSTFAGFLVVYTAVLLVLALVEAAISGKAIAHHHSQSNHPNRQIKTDPFERMVTDIPEEGIMSAADCLNSRSYLVQSCEDL